MSKYERDRFLKFKLTEFLSDACRVVSITYFRSSGGEVKFFILLRLLRFLKFKLTETLSDTCTAVPLTYSRSSGGGSEVYFPSE